MRNVLPVKERLKCIPFPDASLNIVDNPVEVIFKLPNKIYMSKDSTAVKIGVWDEENKKWTNDNIGGDCMLDPETRMIHFTTTKFAPIAML